MALATRCPGCHALFRVVADQLKLRGGLVRCGACGHVFDAIGTLSYLDDASVRPAPAAEPETAVAGTPPTSEAEMPAAAPAPAHFEPATDTQPEEIELTVAPEPPVTEAPVIEPVTQPPSKPEGEREDSTTAAEPVIEGDDAMVDAPAFLHETDTTRRRALRYAYAGGAVLAVLALATQLVMMFRAEIGAQWPAVRPGLAALCQPFQCSVGWPARGEMLAIVGSELQSLPGSNALELTAVVRNRAATTLALPALEVTLTDTQNRAVARKVFAPADYLPPAEAAARLADGLQAGADMTVRVTFEARGLNVVGFVVYPFYL